MGKNEELFKVYQEAIGYGMTIGIALGRFYEKHNITGTIPPELEKEANAIIEKALVAGRKER